MTSSFDVLDTVRVQRKALPLIDDIYRRVWGNVAISRLEKTPRHILDISYAIDVELRLASGLLFTVQEKVRRSSYSRFAEFTIEYWQNPQELEHGEWFKLATDYYFYGYLNEQENAFTNWWILDVTRLKWVLHDLEMTGTITEWQNAKHSRASFKAIGFNALWQADPLVVVATSNRPTNSSYASQEVSNAAPAPAVRRLPRYAGG